MALYLALLALALDAGPNLSAAASKEVARQFCRPTDPGEIIVCGQRQRNEHYRMPDRNAPFDPDGDTPSVMRERNQWIEGGESGTDSCSPVGQDGFTGELGARAPAKRLGQEPIEEMVDTHPRFAV